MMDIFFIYPSYHSIVLSFLFLCGSYLCGEKIFRFAKKRHADPVYHVFSLICARSSNLMFGLI